MIKREPRKEDVFVLGNNPLRDCYGPSFRRALGPLGSLLDGINEWSPAETIVSAEGKVEINRCVNTVFTQDEKKLGAVVHCPP